MSIEKKETLRIAYFVNQYPKVSHTFIRREILALESFGVRVHRIALRGWDDYLTTDEDLLERKNTNYLLNRNKIKILSDLFIYFIQHPQLFVKTICKSLRHIRFSSRSAFRHLITLVEACMLVRILERYKIDHIHGHFGTNTAEVLLICRNLGGPSYSFTIHGPEEFDSPKSILLKSKVHYSKFTLVVSEYGRSQLYRWVKTEDWNKIHVLRCAVEREFYSGHTKHKLPREHSFISVGRLSEQKGQLLLVRACKQLKDEGVDFTLTLAGDGEMRKEIESLIDELDLSENITITGWLSSYQVKDEILRHRYFILPSFAEGLPVVIMEAMFLRRPVISTFIAGIPELVTDGENGLLIPAGSESAIISAMRNIMSLSNDELTKMTNSAFDKVKSQHDITTEAKKLENLIKQNS